MRITHIRHELLILLNILAGVKNLGPRTIHITVLLTFVALIGIAGLRGVGTIESNPTGARAGGIEDEYEPVGTSRVGRPLRKAARSVGGPCDARPRRISRARCLPRER